MSNFAGGWLTLGFVETDTIVVAPSLRDFARVGTWDLSLSGLWFEGPWGHPFAKKCGRDGAPSLGIASTEFDTDEPGPPAKLQETFTYLFGVIFSLTFAGGL